MGRVLIKLGLLLLVVATWIALAAEGDGGFASLAGEALAPLSRAAVVCFALALGLWTVIGPLRRSWRRRRCVRCGARIEPGHTYCSDHLRQTVQEYRDQAHDRGGL